MTELSKNPDDPRPVAMETPPPDVRAQPPELTTTASPVNTGMTSGDGVYPSGTTVTAVATPNVDQHFVNWTYVNGLIASVHQNYTFSITNNTNLIANFAAGTATPQPQGPVNVFNERMNSADGLNRAHDIKTKYDGLGYGPPLESRWVSPPQTGTSISAGQPVVLDESKYMIVVPETGRRRH